MIELVDLRYVHLGASSAVDASKWAQEIYGLEEVDRDNGRIYLRGDDRDHDSRDVHEQDQRDDGGSRHQAPVVAVTDRSAHSGR